MNYGKELFENQKIIILALSKLLTPHCRGLLNDANSETQCNIDLIERYHATEEILKYINE
ncbi:hypothetical protein [Faecalibacillus intestinalis]|jgi:hypothetical protein|uniref:hypothetical protein n=1 Tax=Faecalibacillus intestinalis TaxID=1982626 RepID=UPI0039A37A2A